MHAEWKEHYFQQSEVIKLSSLEDAELRLMLRKLLFEETGRSL